MRPLLLLLFSLLCALPARATVVVGGSHDATDSPYGGHFGQVQFVPLSCPQRIGTNVVWPNTVSCMVANGAFRQNLVGGYYDVSLLGDTAPPGGKVKAIRILVPPNDTNIWQFADCANLATNLPTFMWTNPLAGLNISGTNLIPGTVSSNALDAATRALLGGTTTNAVTNLQSGVTLGGSFSGSFGGNAQGLTNVPSVWGGDSSAIYPSGAAVIMPTNGIANGQSGVTLSGTFSGNGAGLTNSTGHRLAGLDDATNAAFGSSVQSVGRFNKLFTQPPWYFDTFHIWGTSNELWPHVSGPEITNQCYMLVTNGFAGFLKPYGAKLMFIVNDTWAAPTPGPDGMPYPDPVKFPAGLKGVTDMMKGYGISPGLYSSYGTITCMGNPAIQPTNVAAFVHFAATNGFEWIFIDDCGQNFPGTDEYNKTKNALFQAALMKEDKPLGMILNYTSWPVPSNWTQGVTAWQEGYWTAYGVDYLTQFGGSLLKQAQGLNLILNRAAEDSSYIGPGHYAYNGSCSFQDPYTVLTNWCLMSAMVPTMWRAAIANPPAIFTNSTVMGMVHQDPAVIPGQIVVSNANYQVWRRQLGSRTSGTNAIAVINYSAAPQTVAVDLSALGYGNNGVNIMEAITGEDLGVFNRTLTVTVATNLVQMWIATPDHSVPWELSTSDMYDATVSLVTPGTQTPAPMYFEQGVKFLQNCYWMAHAVPSWAKFATLSFTVQAQAGTRWTNSYTGSIYNPSGRVQGFTWQQPVQMPAGTPGSWVVTNVFFTVPLFGTNSSSQDISVSFNAYTNSNARFIGGAIRASYR